MRHSLSYRDRLKSSNAEVAPLDEFIDEAMSILKSQPDFNEWSSWELRHGRWAGIDCVKYLAVERSGCCRSVFLDNYRM